MTRVFRWLLLLGLVASLGSAAGAVTIKFDFTPEAGPYGAVGVTGLGASGAYGASSPVNQVTNPANPTAGTSLLDVGINLDFGLAGISCGTTALSACDYGAPGPSEDALLFDLGGSVTMSAIELSHVNHGALVDGYYWDGSGWVQFFDDAASAGGQAGPAAAFQYLLIELDGNDDGSSSSILTSFRVWKLENVVAAVPEPNALALLGLAAVAGTLRRRR